MAKKIDPNELSIEERLKALYELQLVNSKIHELQVLQGELPQEVKDMSDAIEGLRTRLGKIEVAIKACETEMSNQRVKAENANMQIAKLKEQHENVRNNREFDAISKEIECQQLEILAAQKKIKEQQAAMEESLQEKQRTMNQIEEKTVEINQKRSELNEILAETKEQAEALMVRAGKLEVNIEERLLAAFKRIRNNARNKLAVVTVDRDACGGCHNKIPAQRQIDIRLRKKIIPCEYCGRILIDNDLAAEVKPIKLK